MTLVASQDCERVETIRPEFVPLSAERLQRERKPAHDRVECIDCGRQVNPADAVRTSEGFLHKGCAEDYEWS